MASNLDSDVLASWIGLKTYDGYEVVKLLAVGSSNVVYRVVKDNSDLVLKFPRTHIGFVIGLPPNGIFQLGGQTDFPRNDIIQLVAQADLDYERTLNARLLALSGSPLLSHILPLDMVWQRTAVKLLESTKSFLKPLVKEGFFSFRNLFSRPSLVKFSSLIGSGFISERLNDWASINVGSNPRETIVIYAGDEPIYARPPEFISRDAMAAIKKRNAILAEIGEKESTTIVDSNPFLPFIAALTTGYDLPDSCTFSVAKLLAEQKETGEILRQIGQILHSLTPTLNRENKSQLVTFIMATASATSNIGLEELLLCVEELT